MKKFIYMITIGISMFVGFSNVQALSYKDMNDRMKSAVLNNDWKLSTEISDGEGSFYGIKILVGNIKSDSELKEIYKDVGKKNLGSITINGCDSKESCSSTSDAYIRFGLQKADSSGNIYLYASGVSDKMYKEIEASKYYFVTMNTNGAWIKGNYTTTDIVKNQVTVDDNRDKKLGSYENPFIINGSGSFTIDYPSYKYYYKIIIPNKKYGRYKVTPDSIGDGITTHIVGSDYSKTVLCTDEDDHSMVYYSNKIYYIELRDQKKLLNQTITFTYIDDDKSNMCGGEFAKDPSKDVPDESDDTNRITTDDETLKIIQQVYNIIKILIPVLIIALSIIDFLKVILVSDDKNYKSAWDKFIKRLIIGVIFFLVPLIVSFILKYSGIEIEQSYLEIFK